MSLKEFLKPSKEKILIAFLLLAISVIPALTPVSLLIFPLYFVTILLFNMPIFIIASILLAYVFGCYISLNKKWFRGITAYLLLFLFLSAAMFFGVEFYNNAFGHSCDVDSDCRNVCPGGVVNNRYIATNYPFMVVDCFMVGGPICENKKCESFNIESAKSVKDCERISEKYSYEKYRCYSLLAQTLNDMSICNNIQSEISLWNLCLEQFKK